MKHLQGNINNFIEIKGRHTTACPVITDYLIPIMKNVKITITLSLGIIQAQKVTKPFINFTIINSQSLEIKAGKNNYIQSCILTLTTNTSNSSSVLQKDYLNSFYFYLNEMCTKNRIIIYSNIEQYLHTF
jgi:hypothetical protein